ncbi:zinc-ribbon domain-containing protein [Myxococcota bacterium]|nr:zinc-ribbon domain-containing protein [Myxococcota bacterium]
MIAVCPKCSARYRVDTARVGPEGAKLRCTKCSALFLVRVPTEKAAAAGPLVLVADPDEARGKLVLEAIRSFGLTGHLVLDGVEAMLAIQRMLPAAVVLDAGLPRMYGFQVCEIVKRNESLRSTTVVLVGSVHDASRYRREPTELYGADVYLEQPDLPDGLRAILQERGLIAGGARAVQAPPRQASPKLEAASAAPLRPPSVPLAAAAPSAPMTPVSPAAEADAARDEERERARRLARIAVSEMLLYQPEKFAEACREGTLERALEMEIQEARALIRQRIGPEVRAEADFVLEELHRVARERGAKA